MKREKIEKKYSRLIANTIERMKDRPMEELWPELDKLKAKMAEECESKGIKLESK